MAKDKAMSVCCPACLEEGTFRICDFWDTEETPDIKERIFSRDIFRYSCPECGESYAEPEPSTFSFNSPHGWCPACLGHGFVADVKAGKEDERLSELEKEIKGKKYPMDERVLIADILAGK